MTTLRALCLALLAAVLFSGCAPRVGVVDSHRILTESVLALSFQRQLDEQEKAMAADLQLLSGQLSAQDFEARRQTHLKDLAEMKRDLEQRLNQRIRQEVAEVARRKRLRIVMVRDGTHLGGIDVTDEVIDRLK